MFKLILQRSGLKNVVQLRCVQPTFKYLDVMSSKTLSWMTIWLVVLSFFYKFCCWITRHGLYFLGWHWVHGPVQPSCSCVWCWTTGEDHRCLPWPVSLVWSWQEAPVSSVGETSWHGTSTIVDLQMVPRLVCVWFIVKFEQEVCSFFQNSEIPIPWDCLSRIVECMWLTPFFVGSWEIKLKVLEGSKIKFEIS